MTVTLSLFAGGDPHTTHDGNATIANELLALSAIGEPSANILERRSTLKTLAILPTFKMRTTSKKQN
jgi:hypothetical protein